MAKIINLTNKYFDDWDNFVNSNPQSTFYHTLRWKEVIEKIYGFDHNYLLYEDSGEIQGIFPSFRINNLFSGKSQISLPFGSYGGPISIDYKITDKLVKHFVNDHGNEGLDIRTKNIKLGNFSSINKSYVTSVLALDSDSSFIWENKLNKKIRNAVRKSKRSELVFKSNQSYLADFFKLYKHKMKSFGSPHHSFSFFSEILEKFAGNANISVAIYKGKVISTIFTVAFKDTITSVWAASDKNFLSHNPNNFIYWELIKKSCIDKYKFFDFGRSKISSSNFNFKKKWGAEAITLLYYSNKPLRSSRFLNKREIFSAIWRFIPNKLTDNIGPYFRGRVP